MERKKDDWRAARAATALAALLLACATAWDGLPPLRETAAPAVSYVLLAVAIAVGCLGVLLRVFAARPRRTFLTDRFREPLAALPPQANGAASSRPRPGWLRNVVELLMIGLLLLGWWVRGDPGIPADPPVVALELLGALVLGGTAAISTAPMLTDPSAR